MLPPVNGAPLIVRLAVLWAGALSPVAVAQGTAQGQSPLVGIVQLLQNLGAQLEQDAAIDQELYGEYRAWCEASVQDAQLAGSDDQARGARLADALNEQQARDRREQKAFAAAKQAIDGLEADLKRTVAQREADHRAHLFLQQAYTQRHGELSAAADALSSAETATAQNVAGVVAAARQALVPTPGKALALSSGERQLLSDLAEAADSSSLLQAGSSHGQKLVHAAKALVQSLLERLRSDQDAAQNDEENAQKTFEEMTRTMGEEITFKRASLGVKKSLDDGMRETESQWIAELDVTREETPAASTELQVLGASCIERVREEKERASLRASEIVAIRGALAMLAKAAQVTGPGDATTAPATQEFPMLLQVRSKPSHSQLLEGRALLQAMMRRAQAGGYSQEAKKNPMAGVKKIIQQMIERLLTQAAEEAEHSSWCTGELKKSGDLKNEKERYVRQLKRQITALKATQSNLKDELQQLSLDLATLEKLAIAATGVRAKERQQSLLAVKRYKDAQDLVGSAIGVLRGFYKQQDEASSAVPSSGSVAAEEPSFVAISSGAYVPKIKAASAALGLLEKTTSGFSQLATQMEAAEQLAQGAYQRDLGTNQNRQALVKRDIGYRDAATEVIIASLKTAMEDLKGYEEELKKLKAYDDKVKVSCHEMGTTPTQRRMRNEEEVEKLQIALRILSDRQEANWALNPAVVSIGHLTR